MKTANEKSKNCFSLFLALIAFSLFDASLAFASGAHAEGPLPGFWELVLEKKIYFLNFIVYLLLLGYFLKKIFASAWSNRRVAYKEAITSGQKLLLESEKQLSAAKNLISSLPQELESLRERMTKEVQFEAQHILKDASERASKIKNQASQTAAAEKRAAINKYQDQLVELAIELAKGRVSGLLSEEVDSRLRNRVVSSVSGLVN